MLVTVEVTSKVLVRSLPPETYADLVGNMVTYSVWTSVLVTTVVDGLPWEESVSLAGLA